MSAPGLTDNDIANASQGVTGYPPPWLIKVCDAAREVTS